MNGHSMTAEHQNGHAAALTGALPPHQLGTVPAHAALPAASPIPVPDPTTHRMPSGHTVTVASPRILTRAQRHRLIEIETGIPTINTVATWLITEWSYPFPTPAEDPASLDLIPGEDDDALTAALWPPVGKLLFPQAATPDDHADETSPTAPSGE